MTDIWELWARVPGRDQSIWSLWLYGWNASVIAAEFGVSRSTVGRVLRDIRKIAATT